MNILACHNFYRSTSGEDLVFEQDMEILRKNNVQVVEYRRDNSSISGFTALQKMLAGLTTIYSIRTVHEISRAVERHRPVVAIVQNVLPLISPSIYFELHRKRIPIVQLVYNYRFICPNGILYTDGAVCERCLGGNYVHAVVHKCYRHSRFSSGLYAASLSLFRHWGPAKNMISAYVTPDQFLKKKLVEGGYPKERMFSLLNPFDIEKYPVHFDHKGYLVYFGRIVKEKGIFTLLSAMRDLPDTRLIVVGAGEAEADTKRRVVEYGLDTVDFVGPTYGDALLDILKNATGIIVPTEWYDNSPLVIHQAFALGKPVIASRIDGIPEIVDDGVDGLLFAPGDAGSLREKIRLLASDDELRRRLARNARDKAERLFTAQARFEGLKKVIEFAHQNPL